MSLFSHSQFRNALPLSIRQTTTTLLFLFRSTDEARGELIAVVRKATLCSMHKASACCMNALPLRHFPVAISFSLSRIVFRASVGTELKFIGRFMSACLAFLVQSHTSMLCASLQLCQLFI